MKAGFVYSFLFIPPFCCFLSLYPFPFVFFSLFSLSMLPLFILLSSLHPHFSLHNNLLSLLGPSFVLSWPFEQRWTWGAILLSYPWLPAYYSGPGMQKSFTAEFYVVLLILLPVPYPPPFFPSAEKEARPDHIWYHGLRGRVGMHGSDFDVGNFLSASWPGRSTGLDIRTWVQSRFCPQRNVSPWASHLVSSSIK